MARPRDLRGCRSMPLIAQDQYKGLFRPLLNNKTGFLQLPGNHGDSMIAMATRQMFHFFGCEFREIGLDEITNRRLVGPVDQIVIGGGGSMGKKYRWNYELRRKVSDLGVPVIVFPQTIVDSGEDLTVYRKVYAREQISADTYGIEMSPDLALGLSWNCAVTTKNGLGVFLRNDWERLQRECECSIGDPVELSSSVNEYIALAGSYREIVTDRVHFAIAGLMQGADVTLLNGAYFKNRSLYDSWLKDMGCRWADTFSEIGLS